MTCGLIGGETHAVPRISDLVFLSASTRGKIELTLSEDALYHVITR